MKTALIALLSLVIGAFIARAIWLPKPEPVDPIQVMVTQLKTHAIIEHERGIAVWYRACPDVVGVDPQLFVAWPAELSYELELSDVTIERAGTTLTVRTKPIKVDEPSVPTDYLDYLSTNPLFNFSNEQQLLNEEIGKASSLARYLTAYYLLRDASLKEDFSSELEQLVRRLAGALAVPVTSVKVEIEEADPQPRLPKLPSIALCQGSFASANGLPFAKVEDAFTVPIRFDPAKSATKPAGIASVYGRAGGK
jgi:hypothetical protein